MTVVSHLPSVSSDSRPELDHRPNVVTIIVFFGFLALGLALGAYNLYADIADSGDSPKTWLPFVLLGIALLIALGFEFVNGFHDTANAVATVIYTHSLPPHVAVVWSGLFNFIGVVVASGAVAFGIISLLPVELILQAGSSAGFAMVFALLIAAILWNLATWWLELPASSSHILIGSIIGVGIANALMHGALYREPEGNRPPPWWIRGLLILTCTGVSFAHGSNDGQKGMGLIMLYFSRYGPDLVRTQPCHASQSDDAVCCYFAQVTQDSIVKIAPAPAPDDPRAVLSECVRTKSITPDLIF
jgi:PiT family inorganic phosphate transporter